MPRAQLRCPDQSPSDEALSWGPVDHTITLTKRHRFGVERDTDAGRAADRVTHLSRVAEEEQKWVNAKRREQRDCCQVYPSILMGHIVRSRELSHGSQECWAIPPPKPCRQEHKQALIPPLSLLLFLKLHRYLVCLLTAIRLNEKHRLVRGGASSCQLTCVLARDSCNGSCKTRQL